MIPPLKDRLSKTTITLEEYIQLLQGEGRFVIPNYQRGYVWGQRKKNVPVDSVTYLIKNLKETYEMCKIYEKDKKKDVFLQGITAHGKQDSYDIVLVDGQQRTTFFFLLLKYLRYEGFLKIQYDIRRQSNEFLENLNPDNCERDDNETFQDVFFFKRTLRIFKRELQGYNEDDKKNLRDYLLSHVRFLFVVIPEKQAHIVFTMMNGNKARMTEEELIKAELLRCASLEHCLIEEAEHSELRGRLAREWDRWLYWWNDKKVQGFFRTGGRQLGWLLPLILNNHKITFMDFKEQLLNKQSIKQSKAIFKTMRLLQKSIEDKYEDAHSYNYLGMVMYIRNNAEQRFVFLRWLFGFGKDQSHLQPSEELKRYYDWSIIGVNHEDIVAKRMDKYIEARNRFKDELNSNMLFVHHYETAFRWLLRQNIKEDNKYSGRKFNFEIERDRSLEHVYPKSKVGHKSKEEVYLDYKDNPIEPKNLGNIRLWREDMKWLCKEENHEYHGSEHCIGNLVLLYKRDNSKFNDADFRKKNEYFFTDQDDDAFKSRHLIHTTMVFSDIHWEESPGNPWSKEQVPRRKYIETREFENEYPEHPIINE